MRFPPWKIKKLSGVVSCTHDKEGQDIRVSVYPDDGIQLVCDKDGTGVGWMTPSEWERTVELVAILRVRLAEHNKSEQT